MNFLSKYTQYNFISNKKNKTKNFFKIMWI